MLPSHAHLAGQVGNGVEAGLFEIRDLMMKGKFKVFAGLRDCWTSSCSTTVTIGPHRQDPRRLLDAMRYAYMMRRQAVAFGDVGKVKPPAAAPLPTTNHWGGRR
jgi:hypothetical protein